MGAKCFVDVIRQRSWSISVICYKDVEMSAVQNIIFISAIDRCAIITEKRDILVAQIAVSKVLDQMLKRQGFRFGLGFATGLGHVFVTLGNANCINNVETFLCCSIRCNLHHLA